MNILSIIRGNTIDDIAKNIYDNRLILSMISMHWIMFVSPLIITLLSNDISILVMVSLFLYSILTINIIFHDCPVTLIEDKCLGGSLVNSVNENVHTNYKQEQRGESTKHWLFMAILTTNSKIFLLLIKHCFFTYLSE